MLGSLFRSKKKSAPPAITTDLHSHLLPGIDDGVQTMDEALEVIKGFKNLGYQRLITTPHIMHDYYRNTPDIIQNKLAAVKQALAEAGIEIELQAAAEYYLDEYFLELIGRDKPLLTFGDKYVLFELPFLSKPMILQEVVFALQTKGYRPVLAHAERYLYFSKDTGPLYDLHHAGVVFQLNLLSPAGFYGKEVKKQADKLLKAGLIGMVGSDCHNSRHLMALGEFWHTAAAATLAGQTFLNDTL
ncbi:MAG TPA: capsular biosynthesis protein [Flammeovirgaceae bacterium]|nr:capsular biosynthesis protein [Flammeovirgaceae bacterium]